MRFLLTCIFMLSVVLVQSTAAAPKMESAKFPSARGIEIAGYYFRPNREGTFPAVIAMHGCGGLFDDDGKTLSHNRVDWAQRFLAAGYAVLFPDSYGPRGVLSACETKRDKLAVKLPEHVGDLGGAITWLSSQPFVDKHRIALVGWGLGGSAVLRILDPKFPVHQRAEIKAAIAFYPRCQPLETMPGFVPRLAPTILMGAADEWVPPAPCKSLAARWGSQIILYPGAFHDFDVPDVPVRRRPTAEGPKRAGTNPAARAKAIKEVNQLLAKAFAVPSTEASNK